MNAKSPEIVTKFYDYLLYFIPKISKIPKSQKYLFGDHLQKVSLSILENLIEAFYSREKLPLLLKINIQFEKLRLKSKNICWFFSFNIRIRCCERGTYLSFLPFPWTTFNCFLSKSKSANRILLNSIHLN